MLGKLMLYSTLALSEYMELLEENYEKWMHGCFHYDKDEEICGCYNCNLCGKEKRCVPCLLEEQKGL